MRFSDGTDHFRLADPPKPDRDKYADEPGKPADHFNHPSGVSEYGKKEAGKTRVVLKENVIFNYAFELLHYYPA